MGVNVDPGRPYSDEEKEWLRTRASGESLIHINELQFGHLSNSEKAELRGEFVEDVEEGEAKKKEAEEAQKQAEEDSFDPEDLAVVAPLTVPALRAQLKKLGLSKTGTEEELQLRLLEHLDAQRYPERYSEEETGEDGEEEEGSED